MPWLCSASVSALEPLPPAPAPSHIFVDQVLGRAHQPRSSSILGVLGSLLPALSSALWLCQQSVFTGALCITSACIQQGKLRLELPEGRVRFWFMFLPDQHQTLRTYRSTQTWPCISYISYTCSQCVLTLWYYHQTDSAWLSVSRVLTITLYPTGTLACFSLVPPSLVLLGTAEPLRKLGNPD